MKKKRFVKVFIASVAFLLMPLLNNCVGLIVGERTDNILVYKYMNSDEKCEFFAEDVASGKEKPRDPEDSAFYNGKIIWKDDSEYKVGDIMWHVSHNDPDDYVLEYERKAKNIASCIKVQKRYFFVYADNVRRYDVFRIRYNNRRNGHLIGKEVKMTYSLVDLEIANGGKYNFTKLGDIINQVTVRLDDNSATFIGWFDENGNDIDYSIFHRDIDVYAKWSDEL